MFYTASAYTSFAIAYLDVCPAGFVAFAGMATFGMLQGLAMWSVKTAFNHVKKLFVEDLAPGKITARTRRYGLIARRCPCLSRWIFLLFSITNIFSLGLALSSTCVQYTPGQAPWTVQVPCASGDTEPSCQLDPSGNKPVTKDCGTLPVPNPLLHIGTPAALGCVIILWGLRTSAGRKVWPFLYEPVPDDEEFKASGVLKVCACCYLASRCLHP
eukprot:TRINITY_DN25825_c0_g1_i2.p1 TRINITY_DN25825_c0_g1~~TRINITY_DN25825_c0_g1_i2.p1  ORF type:complete len:250 (+),score=25.16 TRINITY_DN25825_c0_g1_i2:110-751(+)